MQQSPMGLRRGRSFDGNAFASVQTGVLPIGHARTGPRRVALLSAIQAIGRRSQAQPSLGRPAGGRVRPDQMPGSPVGSRTPPVGTNKTLARSDFRRRAQDRLGHLVHDGSCACASANLRGGQLSLGLEARKRTIYDSHLGRT